MQYEHTTTQIPLYWNIQNQITFGIKSLKFYRPKVWKAFHAIASSALISGSFLIMCITKSCTHLHPAPSTSTQLHLPSSASTQLISTSTHLHLPLPSLFQFPPSSLQHPQQYLNQNVARNLTISPNLGQKIKSCPFWLKIGSHGILEVFISNQTFRFLKLRPQNSFLEKFGPKKSKVSLLSENWYTWYLKDVDSYCNISFLNF